MIKAVFFDVDGTLLSHESKQVPLSTRKALDLLKEKGIKRVLATGRHMSELKVLPVSDITFDGYLMMNGQLCLDEKGNVLFAHPIVGHSKDLLLKAFEEKKMPIMLLAKDKMYINFNNEYVEYAQKSISTPMPEIENYSGEDIYQVIPYVSEEKGKELFDKLTDCEVTRWNKYAYDIFASGGGKAKGIEQYIKLYGIDKSETMAFGDGENDVEMLNYVHIGIAMGNGEDIVKENADHVTTSVDEDGIMNGLVHFGILSDNLQY